MAKASQPAAEFLFFPKIGLEFTPSPVLEAGCNLGPTGESPGYNGDSKGLA